MADISLRGRFLVLLALTSLATRCGKDLEEETGEPPIDTGDSAPDTSEMDTAGETGDGETADTASNTAETDTASDTADSDTAEPVTLYPRNVWAWPESCFDFGEVFTLDRNVSGLSGFLSYCSGVTEVLSPPLDPSTDLMPLAAAVAGGAYDGGGDLNADGEVDIGLVNGVSYGPFPAGTVVDWRTPVGSRIMADGEVLYPDGNLILSDTNGDEIGDLIGAQMWDYTNGGTYEDHDGVGAAYILRGPIVEGDSWSEPDNLFLGDETYHGLGYRLGSAGDINGDGLEDVTIVTERGEGMRRVLLFETPFEAVQYGYDASLVVSIILGALDLEGKSAGDWNGDGQQDALFFKEMSSMDTLAAAVLPCPCPCSGTTTMEELPIRFYYYWTGSDKYAIPTARAGDLDGDGFDDLAISAFGKAYTLMGGQEGAIQIFDAPFYMADSNGGILAGHDFDGDEAVDVLVFDDVGGMLSLYSSLDMPS